eukprot:365271-Chlamydomonas_euryale.AAC.1
MEDLRVHEAGAGAVADDPQLLTNIASKNKQHAQHRCVWVQTVLHPPTQTLNQKSLLAAAAAAIACRAPNCQPAQSNHGVLFLFMSWQFCR